MFLLAGESPWKTDGPFDAQACVLPNALLKGQACTAGTTMKYLDDEELPFTREELRQAGSAWLDTRAAEELLESIVASLPGYVAHREELRRKVLRHGGAASLCDEGGEWAVPDILLAYLSTLSVDASARVELLMVKRWAGLRRFYFREALGEWAVNLGTLPASRTLSRPDRKQPVDGAGTAIALPTPPLGEAPPASLVLKAESRVRAKILAWFSLLESVRNEHGLISRRDIGGNAR